MSGVAGDMEKGGACIQRTWWTPARTSAKAGTVLAYQAAIVQALREAGADYVLAVKRNQQTLHREVKAAFDDAKRGAFRPRVEDRCETVARNGGRRERRRCTVLGGPGLGEWVADPAA